MAGDLEAHAPGIIAGLDHRFLTRSSDGLNDAGEGYRLRLLPGRTYTVTFRPDDHDLPPFTFQLDADQDLQGEFDMTLPAIADYDTLAGWVSWGASTPLRGARLTVLLPDGSALPSRVLDTVQAAFNLKVPPGVEQVRLRVAPTDESPLFPIFHTEWLPVADNVEVEVPPLPNGIEPFVARFKVRWPSTSAGQKTWSTKAGLKVVVSGHLESGTLTAVGTTNSEGVAEITLLPGAYDVMVDVGPGVAYGSHTSKRNLQPIADEQATESLVMLDLPDRHRITGLVLNAYGQPVVAGRVEARRRSSENTEGQIAPSDVPYQAELQPDGRFELHVDAAVYELTVRPDASTDAPADRRSGLVVEADVDLTLTLPEAGLARISVLSPHGDPVENATVELYRADDPMSEPLVLVKGTTSETGTVELLVPAEP